jgi:guanylate kinase
MPGSGKLVVISAPSGGGKTTVIREVLDSGHDRFRYSISATTRERRPGEENNKDYHFLDAKTFEQKVQENGFVEWEEVHGNRYGTLKGPLDDWLADDCIVLMDLDVKGGVSVKEKYGDKALLIFIEPPSYDSLVQRLRGRQSETEEQIAKRLQRYPEEMAMAKYYDYRVVNNDLAATVDRVFEIIENETN